MAGRGDSLAGMGTPSASGTVGENPRSFGLATRHARSVGLSLPDADDYSGDTEAPKKATCPATGLHDAFDDLGGASRLEMGFVRASSTLA
jgi:hypothetical protein